MAKVRTTLTIDETVLRAVKIRAARLGRGDSDLGPALTGRQPRKDSACVAEAELAVLVSGDGHLLDLAAAMPVCSPRVFLERLETGGGRTW